MSIDFQNFFVQFFYEFLATFPQDFLHTDFIFRKQNLIYFSGFYSSKIKTSRWVFSCCDARFLIERAAKNAQIGAFNSKYSGGAGGYCLPVRYIAMISFYTHSHLFLFLAKSPRLQITKPKRRHDKISNLPLSKGKFHSHKL